MTRFNRDGKPYQINRTVPVTIVVAEFDTLAEAQKFWNDNEGVPTEPGESGEYLAMTDRDANGERAVSSVFDHYS